MKHHKGTLVSGASSLGLLNATGEDIIAGKFIRDNGTSLQYLMADGSVS